MLEIWGADDRTLVSKYWTPVLKRYEVEHIFHDYKSIDNFLPQSKDSAMLCCGNTYLDYLKSLSILAKGRVIGSVRNTIREFTSGNKLVVGYSPSIIKSDYSKKPDILWDIELACMADKYGKIPDYKGNYREVKDFSEIIDLIERLRPTGVVPVSIDLETMGSNPRLLGKEILSISVTVVEGSADVVYFREPLLAYKDEALLKQLDYLLNDDNISVRGANFKYDLHWIWEKFNLRCSNFKFDTLLVGSLLDENRSNSLDTHAKLVTSIPGYADGFNEKYDKAHMEDVPIENLVHYCLSGESLVQLEDSSWSKIKDLVLNRYSGKVKCYDGNSIVDSEVVGWHRNYVKNQKWFQLETPSSKVGRWGLLGPKFTENHNIITARGKVRVDNLIVNKDKILTSSKKLTENGLSILLGSLLGDGGLDCKNGSEVGFRFGQCFKREAYADWKRGVFSQIVPVTKQKTPKGYRYVSKYTPYFKYIYDSYPRHSKSNHSHRKLILTEKVCSQLGFLGLAVWYQDDGTLVGGDKPTSSRIACVALPKKEVSVVIKWLTNLFGEGVSYNKNNGFIQLNSTAFTHFHKAILPYMHPNCSYKSIFSKEVKVPVVYVNGGAYYEKISAVKRYIWPKSRTGKNVRWCLTVNKFNNFVTPVGVVSNSGGDTDACLRVAESFKNELCLPQNEHMLKFYTRLLHPAARAFELIEAEGVCVDKVKYLELWQELDDYLSERATNIWDIIPSDMYRKPTKKDGEYNPINPTMIKEYLFTKNGTLFTDKGVLRKGLGLTPKVLVESAYKSIPPSEQWNAKGLSVKKFMDTYKDKLSEEERKTFIYKNARTTMKHFKMFEGSKRAGELIKNVKEYTLAKKTLATYVKGFLDYLDPVTEKFYPTYMLFRGLFEDKSDTTGTNTGRTSLFGPALQQLPKHTLWSKKLRSCFTAPKGMVILNVDFSEGELRLIADRSGDPVMIAAYQKGLSLHAITAARLLETPLEEYMKLKEVNNELYENIRRNAKVVNFGLPYGMSSFGLRVYAEDGFGLILSKAQSDKYVDDYFNTYKQIRPWHNIEKTHARNKGYVTSALGRVRHLPMIISNDRKIRSHAERQAVNAPIQSCLSDMLLLSTAELDKLYRGKIFPFLMIHDNLCIYVPENEAKLWAKRVTDVMENLPLKEKFGWTPKVPIIADAEIGYDLAHLEKVEK